jgi:hypothetical protein
MADWRSIGLAILGLVTALGGGTPARADIVLLEATLRGSQEVPAVATVATGTGTVILDTETHGITFMVSHSVANPTAAHFHGTAFPGANAGIRVDIGALGGVVSPIVQEATITPEQQADLLAGRWYLNVHSGGHSGGEIRGQLSVVTPDPIAMFPRSGPMAAASGGDLTILLKAAPGVTVTGGTVTLNGADVTAAFAACVRLGTLSEGGGPVGLTLRCPVPGGLLAVGENFISVVLDLSDQTRVGTSVVYDVAAGSEP